jgi:hypothetical protein
LKKATEFYLKDGKMFKRNGIQLPLLVIHNAKKLAILTQAHENLGHKGEQAVYESNITIMKLAWAYASDN